VAKSTSSMHATGPSIYYCEALAVGLSCLWDFLLLDGVAGRAPSPLLLRWAASLDLLSLLHRTTPGSNTFTTLHLESRSLHSQPLLAGALDSPGSLAQVMMPL
jgi:hypothetical protein